MYLVREIVTTKVIYYRPDHTWLLQEFLWQTSDVIPTLPRIHRFLNYWRLELDAPIHSVFVCFNGIVKPLRYAHEFKTC